MGKLISTLLGLLTVPLLLLNLFGGIVGGTWLIFEGQWTPILWALGGLVTSHIIIGLALAPGALIAVPMIKVAQLRPTRTVVALTALLPTLYTAAVLTIWCTGILYLFARLSTPSTIIPTLLIAYSAAIGPITYMASKEERQPGGAGLATVLATVFTQFAFVAGMGALYFFRIPTVQNVGSVVAGVLGVFCLFSVILAVAGHESLENKVAVTFDLNDFDDVLLLDQIRRDYGEVISDRENSFASCMYRPTSHLPYPKATIRTALQTLLDYVEGRKDSLFLEPEIRTRKTAETIGVALASLDTFIDVPESDLPRDPIQNLRVGATIAAESRTSAASPTNPWLMGAVFLLVSGLAYWWGPLRGHGISVAFGIAVIAYAGLCDVRRGIVPDLFTIGGAFLVLLSQLLFEPASVQSGITGALGGAGLCYVIATIGDRLSNRPTLGGGVIKMALLIGAVVGPIHVVVSLFGGALLGSVASGLPRPQWFSEMYKKSDLVPFAFYFALAGIIMALFGDTIVSWYMTTFIEKS